MLTAFLPLIIVNQSQNSIKIKAEETVHTIELIRLVHQGGLEKDDHVSQVRFTDANRNEATL